VKPRATTCAACHADVHRGTFKQDCKSCHSETGFEKAPFDHTTTAFALTGKHAAAPCAACHRNTGPPARAPAARTPAARRVADFKGLKTACVACHSDVHAGDLGVACESCHSSQDFHVPAYTHRRSTDLFGGLHAPLACEKCHVRTPARPVRTGAPLVLDVRFTAAPTACASCHEDVHLGQVGAACESCHSVSTAKFAASGFSHASTPFALTGKHEGAACAKCHPRETGVFPARSGTAVRYAAVPNECRACHADVHLGQVAAACESCHVTSSFHVARYRHQSVTLVASGFFLGRHAATQCQACHKPVTGRFPAGRGTAVQFAVGAQCVACHQDVHFGSLGPRCGDCHRP
jgi:hypothetical protein